MTRRERLRRCFCHQEVDRPAVYSRAWFPPRDPTYDRLKAYLQAHTELKPTWDAERLQAPLPTQTWTEPHSRDFARQITILHTPAGDLRSTSLQSLKSRPGMKEEHFIKCREDAEKYLSLPLPTPQGDVSDFFTLEAQVGEAGIVDVNLGSNPGGTAAGLCGSETLAMMTATDRDIIHALCQRQMTILINRAKYLLERGVGPYFSMLGEEAIVPPLHGPRDFADFNVRYDRPIIDLIRSAGGRVHIHCHGRLSLVLGEFAKMGVDVLHPIEPPPMGDVTAGQAKALIGREVCIEGNIQIHRMYEASVEEIRRETATLIHDAFGDRQGLIVSPTASPYMWGEGETCFPRYKAMIDTVLSVHQW